MTKQEEVRLKNEALKKENEEAQGLEMSNRELAVSELQQVKENKDLTQMYRDNARAGSENLGGTSPLMKVNFLGKSKHHLANGKPLTDGWFFYAPTQKEYPNLTVHILSISRGFKTKSTDPKKKDPFNQIISGVSVDGTIPFLMYMQGSRLPAMWEFGKEANKYTHNAELPIPLFALTIHLTTRFEKNPDSQKSDAWLIDFEIIKGEDSFPEIITDPQEFMYLRKKVDEVEASVTSLIERIEVGNTNVASQTVDENIPPPSEPY